MNIDDKLLSILSNEIAKSIDAEIIKKVMEMSSNVNRKRKIEKIFRQT